MKSKLKMALELAALGFFVFPLIEGGKRPAIKGWRERASCDPAKITEMWSSVFGGEPRNLNIGIHAGHSGLIIIDIDTKEGKRGDLALTRLETEHGLLPATLRVRTPTGGLHYYFRGPQIVAKVGFLGEGIDIRSGHTFVVAPGSETEKGTYEVIE